MTIFGPDISSFQNGLDVGALPHPFVIAKCTEGTYYTDADYPTWRAQAAAAGKLFVPYHFLSGQDPGAQAAHLAANIGDRTLPIMIDFEPEGSFRPTLAQLLAFADAAATAGLRIVLAYLPRWYWNEIGRPDLTGLRDRRIALVASAYPGGAGYPGDHAGGWLGYGGMDPELYQYTDAAPVQGRPVDMNAFRGEPADLTALLTGAAPMGTIPPSISQRWPELAGDFPPNATFTDEVALIWADGGARAAALYAQQALAEIRALAAQLAAPQTPAPAPVDVDALAAALAPRLLAGLETGTPHDVLAQEIAHAAIMHLGAVLQAGEAALPAAAPPV